jgi:cell division protein FtsN
MKPAVRRYEEQTKRPASSYQLELGTKSLLSLFFALAIVCGLFFAFGYTLGKHAIPATFSLGASPTGHAAAATPAPAAGVQPPNPAELGQAETNQTPDTLTTTTTAAGSATPAAAPPTAPAAAPPPTASGASGTPLAPASPSNAPPASATGVYHVQVFAGAESDAQSSAASLVARGYPAAVVAPAPGGDNLFRVQVGPYLTPDEAQAMRSRLTADGYQAIVKNQ